MFGLRQRGRWSRLRRVDLTLAWIDFERIQWANDLVGFDVKHMKIDHRGADIVMSEEFLNISDIGSRFE